MTSERDKIVDERLIFYLKRRKQIDEWAKLAEVEMSAARKFLRDLTPDLRGMAEGLGHPGISVEHLLLSGSEKLGLWQPNWLHAASGSGEALPRVLIAMGWSKTVRFGVPGFGPYVGLRLGSSGDSEFRSELGRLVHERGLGTKTFPAGKPRGIDAWVRYRYLSATNDRYWEDLGPFRKSLVDAVRDAYREFAPVVDEVLSIAPFSHADPLPAVVEADPLPPGDVEPLTEPP